SPSPPPSAPPKPLPGPSGGLVDPELGDGGELCHDGDDLHCDDELGNVLHGGGNDLHGDDDLLHDGGNELHGGGGDELGSTVAAAVVVAVRGAGGWEE